MKYYLSKQDDPRLLELNAKGYPIKTVLLSILNMNSTEYSEPEFTGNADMFDAASIDIPVDAKFLANDVLEEIKAAGDEKEQTACIRNILKKNADVFFDNADITPAQPDIVAQEVVSVQEPIVEQVEPVTAPVQTDDEVDEDVEIPYILKMELGIVSEFEADEDFEFPGITDVMLYSVPHEIMMSEDDIKGTFFTYTNMFEVEEDLKYTNYKTSEIVSDFEDGLTQENDVLDDVADAIQETEPEFVETDDEVDIEPETEEVPDEVIEEVPEEVEEEVSEEDETTEETVEEAPVEEEVPVEEEKPVFDPSMYAVASEPETGEFDEEVPEDDEEEIPEGELDEEEIPEGELDEEEAPVEDETTEAPEDDEEDVYDNGSDMPVEISNEAKQGLAAFMQMYNNHI